MNTQNVVDRYNLGLYTNISRRDLHQYTVHAKCYDSNPL